RGDGIKPLDGAKINDRKSDAEVVGNAKLPDSGTAAAMERLFPKDGPTTYPMLENIPERKWLEGLISKVGNELLASDIDLNDPALLQQCYEEARQILLSSFME
ncbi:MAG: hypothetical protein IKW74_08415, partial [Thermoguttaceae bacterium]|nr:hypothetical protein [Thermoguttaceae bacterium]